MITPLTLEDEWRSTLDTLPTWQPPLLPTLVLAPHPDDETLGAGGLIARLRAANVPVRVVAVTDGEHAYADATGLAELRIREQASALQHLGVAEGNIQRLHLTDSGVSQQEHTLIDRLETFVTPGMQIVAPWAGDFHPDHEAVGRAAAEVARRTGAGIWFYLFWTWHRGRPAVLADQRVLRLPLTAVEVQQKWQALQCHHSQLHQTQGDPILPANLLLPMNRPYEVFLAA